MNMLSKLKIKLKIWSQREACPNCEGLLMEKWSCFRSRFMKRVKRELKLKSKLFQDRSMQENSDLINSQLV